MAAVVPSEQLRFRQAQGERGWGANRYSNHAHQFRKLQKQQEEMMIDRSAIAAFLRAVFWGAVWGGGILLPFSVAGGIGAALDGEILSGLGLALLPLIVAGAGALAGMLVIGLPLTALLRHLHREREGTYGLAGMFFGLVLPSLSLMIASPDGRDLGGLAVGLTLGLFGMFAGMATGHVWGHWREQCATPAASPPEMRTAPNPIHDLIH